MDKNSLFEADENQLLNEFLRNLTHQLPKNQSHSKSKQDYPNEFKQLVNMTFSANILFRGLNYASRLYNHTVNVQYSYICKRIIKENSDIHEMEKTLKQVKKTYTELMKQSLFKQESKGIALFYTLIGGNRKKYKANQRAIKKMYDEIVARSNQNFFRLIKAMALKIFRAYTDKKTYILWLLKRYTWNE